MPDTQTGRIDEDIPAMPKSWAYEPIARVVGRTDQRAATLFRRQISEFHQQRHFTFSDAREVLLDEILKAAAYALPPRFWPIICSTLSLPTGILQRARKFPDFRTRLELVCGSLENTTARRIFFRRQARLSERKMTVFREAIRPDPVHIEFRGADALDRSLKKGRGVILWSTDMMFRSVVEKRGLWKAGYRPNQISHRVHGFSYSRFGIQHLNPKVVETESAYLAERVVFSWKSSARAIRRVTELLKNGEVVIFTNNITAGSRFLEIALPDAGFLTMSGGPPALSQKLGIPIHTITTVETEAFTRYTTTISEDLSGSPAGSENIELQADIAFRAADEMMKIIRQVPDQYLPWGMIEPVSRFAPSES